MAGFLAFLVFSGIVSAGLSKGLDMATNVMSILFILPALFGGGYEEDESLNMGSFSETVMSVMGAAGQLEKNSMDTVHDNRNFLMTMAVAYLEENDKHLNELIDLMESLVTAETDASKAAALEEAAMALQEVKLHKAEAQVELQHSQEVLELFEEMKEETAEGLQQMIDSLISLSQESLDDLTRQAFIEALMTNRLDNDYLDHAIQMAQTGLAAIKTTIEGFADAIGTVESEFLEMLKEEETSYEEKIVMLVEMQQYIDANWWHLQETQSAFLSGIIHYATEMYLGGSEGLTPEQQIELITSVSESNFEREQLEMKNYYETLDLILQVMVLQSKLDHEESVLELEMARDVELAEIEADSELSKLELEMARDAELAEIEADSELSKLDHEESVLELEMARDAELAEIEADSDASEAFIMYLYNKSKGLLAIENLHKVDLTDIQTDKLSSIVMSINAISPGVKYIVNELKELADQQEAIDDAIALNDSKLERLDEFEEVLPLLEEAIEDASGVNEAGFEGSESFVSGIDKEASDPFYFNKNPDIHMKDPHDAKDLVTIVVDAAANGVLSQLTSLDTCYIIAMMHLVMH